MYFDPCEKLNLTGDASPYRIGDVLSHHFADGSEKPTGYASRTLAAAEGNYCQTEKEGLACLFLSEALPCLHLWTPLHSHHGSQSIVVAIQ